MGSKEFLTDKTDLFRFHTHHSTIPSFHLGGTNRNTFRNSMIQIGIRNPEMSH
jgi:hypothetical protein